MTHIPDSGAEPTGTTPTDQQLEDVVARVLSRAQQRRDRDGRSAPDDSGSEAGTSQEAAEGAPAGGGRRDVLSGRARELADRSVHTDFDGAQMELSERQSLRRVANLSTELEDITEVEYRPR